jgi:hypothetical protein
MRKSSLLLAIGALLLIGCKSHPLTDFRPLDQAGMGSGDVEELKKLNVTDAEVAQIAKLKASGAGDDTCLALIDAARAHKHAFTSADSAISLSKAGYPDGQIIDFAKADKLDSISGDAVMLQLIGLSDSAINTILNRRLKGSPIMGTEQISQLKNTGLTERQILDRINRGMTDAQADKEIRARVAIRNHSNTGFTRVHGRKPR